LDDIDDHPEDMEDYPLLTEAMKSSLSSDPQVKAALNDPTLHTLLQEIDGSERKARKLKEMMERYTALVGVVDVMLKAIGALQEEDGEWVFVA